MRKAEGRKVRRAEDGRGTRDERAKGRDRKSDPMKKNHLTTQPFDHSTQIDNLNEPNKYNKYNQ